MFKNFFLVSFDTPNECGHDTICETLKEVSETISENLNNIKINDTITIKEIQLSDYLANNMTENEFFDTFGEILENKDNNINIVNSFKFIRHE